MYESQKKKWMLEPRKEDGTLDAKVYGSFPELHKLLPVATEDELFAFYFAAPENKGKHSSSWQDLRDWFKEKFNHTIREKTW